MVAGLHDEALGYSFLGVFIIDPATGDRVLQAHRGWKDVDAVLRVHAGEGISAGAVADGRLHYTPDVTQVPAYHGVGMTELFRRVLGEDPVAPAALAPELPAALSDLVMQLLARRVDDRVSSAAVLVERLQALG